MESTNGDACCTDHLQQTPQTFLFCTSAFWCVCMCACVLVSDCVLYFTEHRKLFHLLYLTHSCNNLLKVLYLYRRYMPIKHHMRNLICVVVFLTRCFWPRLLVKLTLQLLPLFVLCASERQRNHSSVCISVTEYNHSECNVIKDEQPIKSLIPLMSLFPVSLPPS